MWWHIIILVDEMISKELTSGAIPLDGDTQDVPVLGQLVSFQKLWPRPSCQADWWLFSNKAHRVTVEVNKHQGVLRHVFNTAEGMDTPGISWMWRNKNHSANTRHCTIVDSMLSQRRGPTLNQQWLNVSSLLGGVLYTTHGSLWGIIVKGINRSESSSITITFVYVFICTEY